MAECIREKKLGTHRRRKVDKNPVWPSSCVTPAGTSNELDVQNKWEENTHTISQLRNIRHYSTLELVRYILLQGHTILYDVVPIYLVFRRIPWSIYGNFRLRTSIDAQCVSPSYFAD